LEGTYPFEALDHIHGKIDWAQIRSDADEAFDFLAARRQRQDGTISFRYDWRALVAVVRMHLPQREHLLGPSMKNFVSFWGHELNPPLGPMVDPATFPLGFCSIAGGEKDLCKSWSATDECPDDPTKTSPGVCGCGTPDTDSDKDGAADCIDECPADKAKTSPGKCGCGVLESLTCGSACSTNCGELFIACTHQPCGCLQAWAECVDECVPGFDSTIAACQVC